MQHMWSTVIRHRLMFLVGVLVTAGVLAVLAVLAESRAVSGAWAVVLATFTLALCVANLVALGARRPAAFLLGDGTFTAPPNVSAVLSAGMFTGFAVSAAGHVADEAHRGYGSDPILIAPAALLLLLLPLQWYIALGRFGLVMRPDGLFDRHPFGSIFVPWEAGPAAQPNSLSVKLRLARPDLVVRRGFRPGTYIATGADPRFTAWVINLYAARPDYRPDIGTQDGLRRLNQR
jgi:hypothetical protein